MRFLPSAKTKLCLMAALLACSWVTDAEASILEIRGPRHTRQLDGFLDQSERELSGFISRDNQVVNDSERKVPVQQPSLWFNFQGDSGLTPGSFDGPSKPTKMACCPIVIPTPAVSRRFFCCYTMPIPAPPVECPLKIPIFLLTV